MSAQGAREFAQATTPARNVKIRPGISSLVEHDFQKQSILSVSCHTSTPKTAVTEVRGHQGSGSWSMQGQAANLMSRADSSCGFNSLCLTDDVRGQEVISSKL